jgi:hypothetical protein
VAYKKGETYLRLLMEQKECSEMSAYKIRTPGNHPKEQTQDSEHGENFKLRGLDSLNTKVQNVD